MSARDLIIVPRRCKVREGIIIVPLRRNRRRWNRLPGDIAAAAFFVALAAACAIADHLGAFS